MENDQPSLEPALEPDSVLDSEPDSESVSAPEADSVQLTDFGVSINGQIVALIRHGVPMPDVLQYVCEVLTKDFGLARCLIWIVVGERLEVINEYSQDGASKFLRARLTAEDSLATVLDFLSLFPDETGSGIINIEDIAEDEDMAGGMRKLLQSAQVRSTANAQLKSRGIFSGFIQMQQAAAGRLWAEAELDELQDVSQLLSAFLQLSFDRSYVASDLWDLKVLYDLTRIFSMNREQSLKVKWTLASELIAQRFGFGHCQIYITGQTDSGQATDTKPETAADADAGISVPLIAGDQPIGFLSMWQRLPEHGPMLPRMRDFATVVANHLAEIVVAL